MLKSKKLNEDFDDLYAKIKSEIEGTEYKDVLLSKINPSLTIDIRVDRNGNPNSTEVTTSVKKGFFKEVSPLILMQNDNGEYTIIDGMTRFLSLNAINPNGEVSALVVPKLDDIKQIYLNLILNTKRANLSDSCRQKAIEFLVIEQNKSIKEAADLLGYSAKDVEAHLMIANYPQEVKDGLDEDVSYRKLQEGVGDVYGLNPDVPTTYKDEVVKKQTKRISDMNANRDSMSVKKIAKTLNNNIRIGHKNGLTPQQVVDATLPITEKIISEGVMKQFQVTGGTDLFCEHPLKLDAIGEYIDKLKPEWFINLFCESKLFDAKDDSPIVTAIERASIKIGDKNCTAVSNFEGIKLDFIKELGVNYHQGDVYDWLTSQRPKLGRGLIFIDSYGSSNYNSISFINYIKNLYPEATIVFLLLDQFKDYRNSGASRLSQYFIMNWGINPVSTVGELAAHFNFEIIWSDNLNNDGSTKERGMYLLKA